jgi:Bacterial Ig-like domain (group 3)/FG-GAP-like repeat
MTLERQYFPITIGLFFLFSLASMLSAQDISRQTSHPADASHVATTLAGAGGFNAGSMISGTPLFLPPAIYSIAGGWSVAIADLNGDGRPDLVVANQYGNPGSIGVMLGNGDGTFQPEVDYSSGGYDFYRAQAVIADVNGDGKLDVIVANEGSTGGGSVGVLLGNGDGTFQDAVAYSFDSPSSIAVADLNADGKLDLVLGGCCSQTVGVMLGNGDGTFQPAVSYPSVGYYINAVVVADVTGDGRPDILVAGSTGIGISKGKGDGTFQPVVLLSLGQISPDSITTGDINGDGKIDLIVALDAKPGLLVLLGNGDGTFQAPVAYNSGDSLSVGQAVLADVNGDGKVDLLETTATIGVGGSVGVLLGNGDGTFQPVVTYPAGGFLGWLAVADLNGDGKNDVVAIAGSPNSVDVLMNDTGPHLPTTTALVTNINPATLRQYVTYTATVTSESGKPATRSVTFQDGGAVVATVPIVANQASYTTWYLKSGDHAITATYPGDAANLESASPALSEYIERLPIKTVMTLSTSGSPALIGRPVTFTATVTWNGGRVPDGETVTFEDSGKIVATVPLVGGTASYTSSTLVAKTQSIKASYAGNETFRLSFAIISQIVELNPTVTTISTSSNPSIHGQALTLKASISSGGPVAPTGKVRFSDGSVALGIATVNGGVATLTKSTLAVGSHSITVEYFGDAGSAKSTSPPLVQVVN